MTTSQELGPTLLDFDQANIDAQEPVLEIRRLELPEGFFNAAAWSDDTNPESPIRLLGRYVTNRGEPGQPDVGTLAMATIVNGKVSSLTEVWRPEGDLLEDPRIVAANGTLTIGLTRLAGPLHRPYPAFSITTSAALLEGKFPETRYLIDQRDSPDMLHLMEGKNSTPVGVSDLFIERRETDSHQFVVSHLDTENPELPYLITIPEVPEWGKYKMGTTMPPIWLNAKEAVMLPHGLTEEDGKLIYRIGSMRLFFREDGKLAVDNISRKAHLTPDLFNEIFQGEQVELRPDERRAVYLTGGIAVYKSTDAPEFIKTYPNVGDTRTVEATFSVSAITANWHRPETSVPLIAA